MYIYIYIYIQVLGTKCSMLVYTCGLACNDGRLDGRPHRGAHSGVGTEIADGQTSGIGDRGIF